MSFPSISLKQSFRALEVFDEWNEEKKKIHSLQTENIYISPREVWYIKMGVNIGNEQNGKGEFRRPVLVIRRIGNMFFAIPLTTKGKENNQFYLPLNVSFSDKKSWIMMSQGRTFDKRRFVELIGSIPAEEFYSIKKSLRKIYFGETESFPSKGGDPRRTLLPSEEGILHRENSSGHL